MDPHQPSWKGILMDDSQNKDILPLSKLEQDPESFETEYVQQVYNNIASHFSHTRYKGWPLIEKFLKGLASGSLVADVGCGNGKYLSANSECFFLGSDHSDKLIEICKERGFNAFVADGLDLPYRDKSFVKSTGFILRQIFSGN